MSRDDTGFYFAFPRLIASLLGAKARRSERSAIEAFGMSICAYLIHFGYAAVALRVKWFLLLVALAFAVWLWWLLILYVNSLVAKLLALVPALRPMPLREIASVIFCAETTGFAFALLSANSLFRWLAIAWLIAVVLNGIAAVLPAFRPQH